MFHSPAGSLSSFLDKTAGRFTFPCGSISVVPNPGQNQFASPLFHQMPPALFVLRTKFCSHFLIRFRISGSILEQNEFRLSGMAILRGKMFANCEHAVVPSIAQLFSRHCFMLPVLICFILKQHFAHGFTAILLFDCRVRRRRCRHLLPSEPDGKVSLHPAQAVAKLRANGAGFHDGLIPASWRWMPNFLRNARSAK